MAAAAPGLSFDTSFAPAIGQPEQAAPGVVRVTAPNAGPFTFHGTNSFILGEARVAVIDPGPADARHLAALIAAIRGRPVEAILITHTHRDHSGLAARLRDATGAPLWFEGRHRPSREPRLFERNWARSSNNYGLAPDRRLADGETIEVAGMRLAVIATPGHCANHLCFGVAGTPWLLSGDHVMGWSSTVVAPPDGSMADYLGSLEKVIDLPYAQYLPAHGGAIADGPSFARALLAHRHQRNAQIVTAVKTGARSVGAVRRRIYPALALPLIPAARLTILAHVEYLVERGKIGARFGPLGTRLRAV